jgi:hypothetical protein
LKNFIGKYALRINPRKGDHSHTDNPLKVKSITERGILVKPPNIPRFLLSHAWNDNQWTSPSPNTHPHYFLFNLCLEISEKGKRRTACRLVNDLYSAEDGICASRLMSENPWEELMQYTTYKRNAQKLIGIIEQLKELLGPLTIEWPQSHTSSSTVYSSPRYDFHLPAENSRKRKLLA